MKKFLIVSLGILLGCNAKNSKNNNPAINIVNEAIEAHGGKRYDNIDVEFDFRKYHYTVVRNDGQFNYTRSYEDTTGMIVESLTNNGVEKTVDGGVTELDDKMQQRISGSINSQVYFALLPHALNDEAVQKKYLGEKVVEGEPYHKVEVTFLEQGGGEDFEDVYIYWFHKENKTMDYLAYEFHVNKGGFRFRKAYNVRDIGGIRFVDYINYKESDATTPLVDYDSLLEVGTLVELSRVELKNIMVK